jgi:gluconokinase
MVIVLMGVSGCGKTTVGRELARSLGWEFHDGDDHHPAANREKMRLGIALTEADRQPWLERLAALIRGWSERGQGVVLACSALSRYSREVLGIGAASVELVHLRGDEAQIRERLERRAGHYFPAALLASQFAALEEPTGAIDVGIDASPEEIAREIRRKLTALREIASRASGARNDHGPLG